MSLIVIGMAVVLLVLQPTLLTSSAVVFTLVLLLPSLFVDLMVFFGPRLAAHTDLSSTAEDDRRDEG